MAHDDKKKLEHLLKALEQAAAARAAAWDSGDQERIAVACAAYDAINEAVERRRSSH